MFYAGIGPRKTPTEIQKIMTSIARQLTPTDWVLRSGHAKGADQAFEQGTARRNIYLPWSGYNDRFANGIDFGVKSLCKNQLDIAARHHPAWERCSQAAKLLLCRNVPIILGETLDDPVEMVITWTPDDRYSGGTTHALRIASTWGIPVFDIRKAEDQSALCKFVLNRENSSKDKAA